MLGKKCLYDDTFDCFKASFCDYENLRSCLKISVVALTRDNVALKHRQMLKHTKASLAWRNSSFYYKKRAKELEDKLREFGISVKGVE